MTTIEVDPEMPPLEDIRPRKKFRLKIQSQNIFSNNFKKHSQLFFFPIVIVPKKSAPGEPPKRRLRVDFRKVNKLQQEVIPTGKTEGQISIHSLPKIDEMYAKLKGAKVF